MKSGRLHIKLRLNKQTISSLNNLTMAHLKGGGAWTVGCTPDCYSIFTLCQCDTGLTVCTCPECPVEPTEYPPHCDNTICSECIIEP